MKKLAMGAVTALGGALALGGCGVAIHATTYHSTSSYEVNAAALKRLTVSTGSGDVRVTGGDGTTVRVTEESTYTKHHQPKAHHTQNGDTLSLGYTCPSGLSIGSSGNCGISYTLQVPRALAFTLNSGSGNLDLEGITGPVQVRLAAGDISADELHGHASLRTDSGNITVNGSAAGSTLDVQDASGDIRLHQLGSSSVQAHTDSGNTDLTFRTAPSSVDAGSASGDVSVGLPKGPYAVTADSSSGDRTVDVAQDPASQLKIKAHTDSGNVRVYPA